MDAARSARWVLLPGTLCTGAVFAPMLDALGVPAARRQVLTLDLPAVEGYGERLAAEVQGGEIVCGFSLGAIVAAHNLPALARARAVVLLALNPGPDAPGGRARREAVRDRVLAGGARDWVRESWPAMAATDVAALRARVAEMAEASAPLIAAQTELAATRPGAAAALGATPLPLVLVTGAADRQTPAGPLRPIAGAAPSAALRVVPGLGHFALLEAPDRVAAAVAGGLAEVLADDGHARRIGDDPPGNSRHAS